MTHDDEQGDGSALAPVTPLFGVRGAGPGRRPVSSDAPPAPLADDTTAPRRRLDVVPPVEPVTTESLDADDGDAALDPDGDVQLDPVTGWAVSGPLGSGSGRPDAVDGAPAVDEASLGEGDTASTPGDPVAETAERLAAISAHWSAPTSPEPTAEEPPAFSSPRSRSRLRAVEPTIVPDADATEQEPEPEPEDLDAQQRRAENVSLHALSRRGVSSAEMTTLLRSRDLDEEIVLGEVARLEGVGLLNDRELAENLVRSKQERKGLGRGAVTSELRQRGLDASVVEEALADIDDDDEQSRADEWARKRVGSLRGLDHATAERRLNGYLMRRGYRSDVVRRAIEKVLPRGGSPRGGGVRFE
ncbi:RecX family transcriptional regulator [Frigoribacterium sp. NBH87]|uniref:regulatory protein RecX n=1 Tax=Frigoribacterium sp. NBH87 TaxID=2596916 RepID=UPI00162673CC|nr:regulatory protein RecX [Frigoribacterium sp. NBH87]QNE42986.1 RecX family transcriptional regulator [Frigoribacterium sp. NBH87]